MPRYVFDIETDGLLVDVSVMHLLVSYDLDTFKMKVYREGDLSWQDAFDNAEELIGHNIIGYDLSVLKKLFGYTTKNNVKIFDTLLYSQILNYHRFYNKRHNLDTWGEYLKYPKTKFEDWTKYSDEMLEYCKNDVKLTVLMYNQLAEEYKIYVGKAPKLATYIEAEHYAAEFVADAELYGFPFNVQKAKELFEKLSVEIEIISEKLDAVMGNRVVIEDACKGEVDVKEPKWTKEGRYVSHLAKWFEIDPWSGYPGEERLVEGPYCRVSFRKMAINSSTDVKLFLHRHGWEPTEYNFVTDKETGKKVKSSPKITEDSLELLGGDGKLYLEYLTCRSRFGILKTWLENVDENGRLHGSVMLIGTPSMRARHSIIVNIPSVDSKYGPEMRELFHSNDWAFIGADSSGNQARSLAHYLKNEEYIDVLLNGDIHQYNADALTRVLKGMKIKHKVPRNIAKRVLYAFLFGASGGKLWFYIFNKNNSVKGNKLKRGFLKAVPGFQELIDKLNSVYESTSQMGDGYIPSIAGNKIYCDSPHKLLVYLLQAAEKITCSTALMLAVKELRRRNIPYQPLIFYHDEFDIMTPFEYSNEVAELSKNAFKEGPKLYGINIMDGGVKIGKNWRECH